MDVSGYGAALQSGQEGENARQLAHQVIDFLITNALHPSPVNYTVAYEYRLARVPALNARIDDRLAGGKHLDDLLMRELYDEHLAREQFRSLRGLGGSLQELVEGLIGDITAAGENASGFRSAVEHNIDRLASDRGDATLSGVAADLLAAAIKAHSGNEALRKNLEVADQEARKLRGELDRHRREALIDPLTGLLNRRGLDHRLEEIHGLGEGDSLAMVVLDIDHFKRVNDTYGHAVGDVVIRHVAQVMRTAVRAQDVTVRFGGEEFVIVMPQMSLEEAETVAESIRARVERLRLTRRQDQLKLDPFTISLGVATRRAGEDFEGLFARADQALYAAKNSGRNRVLTERVLS